MYENRAAMEGVRSLTLAFRVNGCQVDQVSGFLSGLCCQMVMAAGMIRGSIGGRTCDTAASCHSTCDLATTTIGLGSQMGHNRTHVLFEN